MSSSLQRVTYGLFAAFVALALATGYWSLARRDSLLSRGDNPRFIISEARIERGVILDRTGAVLAQTEGEPGNFVRAYALPEAVPVVGYANFRYGVAGIEAAWNPTLRGDLEPGSWQAEWELALLGQPQIGRGVRLTLDAELQHAAATALGDAAGAVVVLNPVTGEVLAMVSSPTFDPNALEAEWEALVANPAAPLLNRATFGSYQPGGSLEPILVAAALQNGRFAPNEAFADGAKPLAWQGGEVACARTPASPLTLAAAFAAACPEPFAQVGLRFATRELAEVLAAFGLYNAPQFSLPTVVSPRLDIPETPAAHRLAAAGQGDLRVSPLQMALVAAAFANGGTLPPLQIVVEVQAADGRWEPQAALGGPRSAVSATIAQSVAALFPTAPVQLGPTGPTVTVAGHASQALTGPQAEPVAWYLGFAPAEGPQIAIAVLVEDAAPDRAEEIGQQVFEAALRP